MKLLDLPGIGGNIRNDRFTNRFNITATLKAALPYSPPLTESRNIFTANTFQNIQQVHYSPPGNLTILLLRFTPCIAAASVAPTASLAARIGSSAR